MKKTELMTREELLNEAVRLLRTIHEDETEEWFEENRKLFDRYCTDSELKEYINDIHENGFREMTDEEREEMCERDAEWEMFEDEHYTPSATARDYSPSCPWKAPGMKVSDFI